MQEINFDEAVEQILAKDSRFARDAYTFVREALDFEIKRQVELVTSGGAVEQETRLYDPETRRTRSMRSKEEAHDYRYFPEPDLVPLVVSDEWRDRLGAAMPELPSTKRARFIEEYGLREYDAEVLTQTRALSEYFEIVAAGSGDARSAANWVMGDLAGELKAAGKEIAESPVSARHLGELVALINKGEISGKLAKDVFAKMFTSGLAPQAIIEREGLKQISDVGALEKVVDQVLAANPKQVEQYKSGKIAVVGFLVGQVMKATRGQANPAAVNDILKGRLQ